MLGVDRYAGLEVALDKLIELLVAEFGASLHAVWVGGSLVLGKFDARNSDIDVASATFDCWQTVLQATTQTARASRAAADEGPLPDRSAGRWSGPNAVPA